MVYPDIEDVYSLEQGSDWSLEYKKDLALTQVIKYVQEGTNPSNEERRNLPVRTNQLLRWFKYLYVEDGLLHLLKPNSAGSRVVIPKGLERKLVDEAHRGHTGITETLDKLRLRGYFPGMTDMVTLIVNNCIPCLQKSNQIPLVKVSLCIGSC